MVIETKKSLLLLCIFLIIAFGGCNDVPDNNDIEEIYNESIETIASTKDEIAHQLAQMIAASTTSIEGKNFIKNEVEKQFDGDYNFLFVEAIDKSMTGTGSTKSSDSSEETFGSFLSKYSSSQSGLKSTTSDMSAFYKQIEKKYPLLQVAVPNFDEEAIKAWEKGEKPLVAILESDYDDQTTKTIVAYDSEGKVHYLDATIEPQKPVIVISPNERLIAVPKTNLKKAITPAQPVFETESYSYYFREYDILPYRPTISILNPITTGCDRDANDKKDFLNKAKFVNTDAVRKAESWANGRPEVYVIITYADSNGAKTLSKDLGSTGWCDINWLGKVKKVHEKNLDVEVFTWIYTQMGDRMKYTFMEADVGDVSVTFKTSISGSVPVDSEKPNGTKITIGGEAAITIGKNDDNLKDAIVEYKDSTTGEGTKYTTGIIEFWVNQQ